MDESVVATNYHRLKAKHFAEEQAYIRSCIYKLYEYLDDKEKDVFDRAFAANVERSKSSSYLLQACGTIEKTLYNRDKLLYKAAIAIINEGY